MKKWMRTPMAAVSVLVIAAAACSSDSGSTASGCNAEGLTGYALGAAPMTDTVNVASGKTINLLAQDKPTVKIGWFGDLTSANKSLTISSRNATELAIEQANAAGTLAVNVEFVAKDNPNASDVTSPAIEQGFVADDEMVGVVGETFSGETLAVGEIFAAAGLTHVSGSATNPDITTHGWPFFRALSTDAVQGAKAAALIDGLGCTKVAVVNDKSDYGQGLADIVAAELKGAGITPVLNQGIEPANDYSSIVTSLKTEEAEIVFYSGYVKEASLLVKQMREAGVEATFMSGDGTKEQAFIDQAGAANAEGTILTCPCADPNVATDAASVKFVADYTAKFGGAPGIYGAEGYDAANIILAAIDASDDDAAVTREEVFTFIDALEGFEGLTKTFTFDETGEIEGGAVIAFAVKDGAIIQLGTVDEVI